MSRLFPLLVLFLAVTIATPAGAQCERFALESRDLGVFADTAGTNWNITAVAFVPFFFYVLAWDVDGDLRGFELEMMIDPQLTVLDRILGAGWSNAGALDNFIVETGACLNGAGVWLQLVAYQAGYFVPVPPHDVVLCPGPSSPSSFVPAVPGYAQCDGSLVAFGVAPTGCGIYPQGCGVINVSDWWPCPGGERSFGRLKAMF